jgi:hypothetical protein
MSEPGAPRPERIRITSEEVIDAYKAAKQGDNSDLYEKAGAMYEQWVIQEEGLVGRAAADQIEFEFRRAEIFIAIDFSEVASEALIELAYRIRQENGPRMEEFLARINVSEAKLQK